jgi:hypothetical protein
MPVTIPATGTGTATPIVSTDNVTADSSQVQNVALVTVSGGVLTRVAAGTQYVEDTALGATPTGTAIMGYGSTAVPTAVSNDGDAVTAWYNRNGGQIVGFAPHVALVGSPWTLTSKTVQTTSTQTSGVVMAGGASETLVVTCIQIQAGGTVAGTVQVYYGTGAYSRGTSRAIFDGEFAPSATLKPGVIMQGPFIAGAAGDDVLVTTSAAINPLTITIWYYIVT